ncbi:ribonuclease E/G, partial [Bordetella avium]
LAPVETAPVAAAAPVETAPVAASPAAPIVVSDNTLNAVVQAAGLTWVQTDPARQVNAAPQADAAPVRLGRERKPVAQVSATPLVQVETQQ